MKSPFSAFLNIIRQFNRAWLLPLVCSLLLTPTTGYTQDGPQLNLPRVSLQAGMHRIEAQVAQSGLEKQIGLMFRKSMPVHEGMLFIFPEATVQCFWMKNTLIPLDMIFADETGLVTVVHSDAVPQDLTPIDGGEGVMYVLEINGGLAKRIGIAAGAEMRFDLIDPSKALWSCAD